jgi:hypothetical protein
MAQIQQPELVLRPDRHRSSERFEHVQEGHRRPAAPAVHEPPRPAATSHLGDHGQQRRDADSPGQEEVFGRVHQREVIPRAGRDQLAADRDLVVHARRATATVRLAQHGHPPVTRVRRVAAQRVLAHQATGQVQVDVCAGLPGWQRATVRRAQRQADDRVGEQLPLVDHQDAERVIHPAAAVAGSRGVEPTTGE